MKSNDDRCCIRSGEYRGRPYQNCVRERKSAKRYRMEMKFVEKQNESNNKMRRRLLFAFYNKTIISEWVWYYVFFRIFFIFSTRATHAHKLSWSLSVITVINILLLCDWAVWANDCTRHILLSIIPCDTEDLISVNYQSYIRFSAEKE